MRKYLFISVLLLFVASASSFTASIETVDREASPEDQALFNVSVFNNHSEERRFTLDYEFSNSGWIYLDTSKVIPPGESRDFRVSFTPSEDALEGSYSFSIYVKDFKSGQSSLLTDYVRVNRQYRLNVKEYSFSKSDVDPGSNLEASVSVQNILPRIVDGYQVSSSFMDEDRNATVDPLAPGSIKTYDFAYSVSEDAVPSEENISLTVSQDGEERVYSQLVRINEVFSINRSESETDRVITVSGTRTVENNGNSQQNVSENITFSSYLDPVISFSPEPDEKVEGEKNTYIWYSVLEPGEQIRIDYRIDYWVPLVLALLVISGISLFSRMTGAVKVSKEKEHTEEGLKIFLTITNETGKYRPQVEVRDHVPLEAEVDETFDMGDPELEDTETGTSLTWRLEDFNPGEERVIQYNISFKEDAEEEIQLPEAEIIGNDENTDSS